MKGRDRRRWVRFLWAFMVVALLLALFPVIASADNCGSLSDCWATALGGTLGALGLAGVAGALGLPQPAPPTPPEPPTPPPPPPGPPPETPQQQADRLAHEQAVRDEINRLQHLVAHSNPSHSVTNCGKEVDAVDKSLGDGKPRSAPNGLNGSDDQIANRYHSHWQNNTSPNDASAQLRASGDGSRGIIGVQGTDEHGNPGGHVFNVVNHNGDIYYVDGQSGKVSTNIGDVQPGGTGNDNRHFSFLPTHPPK